MPALRLTLRPAFVTINCGDLLFVTSVIQSRRAKPFAACCAEKLFAIKWIMQEVFAKIS